jgi:hypothetical protein
VAFHTGALAQLIQRRGSIINGMVAPEDRSMQSIAGQHKLALTYESAGCLGNKGSRVHRSLLLAVDIDPHQHALHLICDDDDSAHIRL